MANASQYTNAFMPQSKYLEKIRSQLNLEAIYKCVTWMQNFNEQHLGYHILLGAKCPI